jgi:hypothetical protein
VEAPTSSKESAHRNRRGKRVRKKMKHEKKRRWRKLDQMKPEEEGNEKGYSE